MRWPWPFIAGNPDTLRGPVRIVGASHANYIDLDPANAAITFGGTAKRTQAWEMSGQMLTFGTLVSATAVFRPGTGNTNALLRAVRIAAPGANNDDGGVRITSAKVPWWFDVTSTADVYVLIQNFAAAAATGNLKFEAELDIGRTTATYAESNLTTVTVAGPTGSEGVLAVKVGEIAASTLAEGDMIGVSVEMLGSDAASTYDQDILIGYFPWLLGKRIRV